MPFHPFVPDSIVLAGPNPSPPSHWMSASTYALASLHLPPQSVTDHWGHLMRLLVSIHGTGGLSESSHTVNTPTTVCPWMTARPDEAYTQSTVIHGSSLSATT